MPNSSNLHRHKKSDSLYAHFSAVDQFDTKLYPNLKFTNPIHFKLEKGQSIYIPKGFAHGYQTLSNNCQILYFHTEFYKKESENGFSYNSPFLNIKWPLKITNISKKDSKLKDFHGDKSDL